VVAQPTKADYGLDAPGVIVANAVGGGAALAGAGIGWAQDEPLGLVETCRRHGLAANSCQLPSTPFSWRVPRSSMAMSEPTTRS
jgi:hypothetical protein